MSVVVSDRPFPVRVPKLMQNSAGRKFVLIRKSNENSYALSNVYVLAPIIHLSLTTNSDNTIRPLIVLLQNQQSGLKSNIQLTCPDVADCCLKAELVRETTTVPVSIF